MGCPVKDLKDGHYAKTIDALTASVAAAQKGCELQIDTGYEEDPFGNGMAYVLFSPLDEYGDSEVLGEFSSFADSQITDILESV